MRKILIVFVHPSPSKSRINIPLLKGIRDVAGVSVRDLYSLYPDFHVSAADERVELNATEVIVFQHPLYWYSAPALLKEWIDTVLVANWAYGARQALRGKKLLSVITVGGSKASYNSGGHNNYSLRQLLLPFEQLANFCGMDFVDPLIFYDVHTITPEQIATYIEQYRSRILVLSQES